MTEHSVRTSRTGSTTSGSSAIGHAMAASAALPPPSDLHHTLSEVMPAGLLRRAVTRLYAARKLILFMAIHYLVTLLVWVHYSLVRWGQQSDPVHAVPEGAPYYWFRRVATAIVFGCKHAILVQMAALPLSMARFSIACLSDTWVGRFVPLEQALHLHIAFGYTMGLLTVTANALFVVYYGTLCGGGVEEYCGLLWGEIMLTGYAITAIVVAMMCTSYLRDRIQYEIFYVFHQLVFVLYALTVLHTLDRVSRTGKENRYQTFQWIVGSFTFYICDRLAMRLNHKYKVRLVTSSTVKGSNGSKMLILRIRRPILFDFKPGQYAFLRVPEIDSTFHPFTIASGPLSKYLEFYIESFGEESWTGRLWRMLEGNNGKALAKQRILVEVMGPYGTNLGTPENYSHSLAIGSGTGIVPVLSLLKQHVQRLKYLDPQAFFLHRANKDKRIAQIQDAAEKAKGPLMYKLGATFCNNIPICKIFGQTRKDVNDNGRKHGDFTDSDQLSSNAKRAARSINGAIWMGVLTLIGTLLIGMTASWHSLNLIESKRMFQSLEIMDLIFETIFILVSLFIWDGHEYIACIDAAICIAVPLVKWFVFTSYDQGSESFIMNGILDAYMTLRFWYMAVKPRNTAWCKSRTASSFDRLDMVWVTRSCTSVSKILPDIEKTWDSMEALWGSDLIERVLRIKIYITDKNPNAIQLLRQELVDSSLFDRGWIQFERPDFVSILEEHSLELICSQRRTSGCSATLLSFCGSPVLGCTIHQAKISNDMALYMTGNKRHQMEFVSDSYGGMATSKRKRTAKGAARDDPDAGAMVVEIDSEGADERSTGSASLTTRRDVEFQMGRRQTNLFVKLNGESESLEAFDADTFSVTESVAMIGVMDRRQRMSDLLETSSI